MNPKVHEFIRRAVWSYRTDDFARAKWAFQHCSPSQMQEKYGDSDQTRQEILDAYEEQDQLWSESILVIDRLFKENSTQVGLCQVE